MSDNPIEPVVSADGSDPSLKQPDYSQNALWKKANGDWEKASDSYFNAVNELGNIHNQLKTESAARQQLEAMVMAAAGGKTPDNQANPFAELESLGISSAAIDAALEKKARTIVESQMQTLFSPIVNQIEAEERLASEIEDFDQYKAEARAFMKQNAEVGDTFKAIVTSNPVAAWKYAIRESAIAKQATQPRKLPPGLPGGRASTGRSAPATQTSVDEQRQREAEAAKYITQFGDARPYRHERFKGTSIERAVNEQMARMGFAPPEE